MIWNLTPHPITIFDEEGKRIVRELKPMGQRIHLKERSREVHDYLGDTPLVGRPEYGEVRGLPPCPPDGPIPSLIVSRFSAPFVADLWPGLVLVPDTSRESVVRNKSGRVIGIRRLEDWSL